jgi:hypothetical protein
MNALNASVARLRGAGTGKGLWFKVYGLGFRVSGRKTKKMFHVYVVLIRKTRNMFHLRWKNIAVAVALKRFRV